MYWYWKIPFRNSGGAAFYDAVILFQDILNIHSLLAAGEGLTLGRLSKL
jgi:hypothetical protein